MKKITIEQAKDLLSEFTLGLPLAKTGIFDSNFQVKQYHYPMRHLTYKEAEEALMVMSYKIDGRMPCVKTFSELLGHRIPDTETDAQLIYNQIRQHAQQDTSLSENARYILKQLGLISYDIKFNMKSLESITAKKIAMILKARPIEEENTKRLLNEKKNNKNLLPKPQEVKPTQNPSISPNDGLREQADKILAECEDKYIPGECVKDGNTRNPLLNFKIKKDLEND